ncbi:MAG: hypothetical protein WAW31_06495 [Smithella sp.]
MTIKTTNKFSIITIINWVIYQSDNIDNDTLNDKPLANKGQHTNIRTHNNKTPEEIFSQIQLLEERYSDSKELLKPCFESIASTRKSNHISDSVKINILQQWNKYHIDQVLSGIRTFLEKDYAAQGKKENYLLGIIKGSAQQKTATSIPGGKVIKSTGSAALDHNYRQQGFTII